MIADIKITNYKKLKEAEDILEEQIAYHKEAMKQEFHEARQALRPYNIFFEGAKAIFSTPKASDNKRMLTVFLQPVLAFAVARIIQRFTGKSSWANLGASVVTQFFGFYKNSLAAVFKRLFKKNAPAEFTDAE